MASFPGFGRCFDHLMRVTEGPLSGLNPILKNSQLFCFPHDSRGGLLPKTYTQEEQDFWNENFALPFPITAIEDRDGLCVLWDSTEDLDEMFRRHPLVNIHDQSQDQENLLPLALELAGGYSLTGGAPSACHPSLVPKEGGEPGCGAWRYIMVAQPMDSHLDPSGKVRPSVVKRIEATPGMTLADNEIQHKLLSHFTAGRSAMIVTVAAWNLIGFTQGRLKCAVVPLYTAVATKTKVTAVGSLTKFPGGAGMKEQWVSLMGSQEHMKSCITCAAQEIIFFQNPDRFVVQQKPPTGKLPRPSKWKGGKRTKERKVYHSWTPLDIRKVRESCPDHEPGSTVLKRGHWRRGHFRTLSADRYARSGLQGKTILIRPCFVGDPDFVANRVHYRVLLGEEEVLVGQQQDKPKPEEDLKND